MPFVISLSAVVCISTLLLLHQFLSGALTNDDAENAS